MLRIGGMNKHDALAHFDGSVKAAATEIGCTQEAIRMWPDPLPPRIRDRVQAALWRRQHRPPSPATGKHDAADGGEAVHVGNVGVSASTGNLSLAGISE
jgi:transcriptional repressor of cell division inhibition gene dicB